MKQRQNLTAGVLALMLLAGCSGAGGGAGGDSLAHSWTGMDSNPHANRDTIVSLTHSRRVPRVCENRCFRRSGDIRVPSTELEYPGPRGGWGGIRQSSNHPGEGHRRYGRVSSVE